jgi:Gly-Xaa carboxypeptidase
MAHSEKVSLPTAETSVAQPGEDVVGVNAARPRHRLAFVGWVACLAAIAYLITGAPNPMTLAPSLQGCFSSWHHHHHHHGHEHAHSATVANNNKKKKEMTQCRQPAALFPASDDAKLNESFAQLSSAAFRTASIARLSGAVRVRTESFDDLGPVGADPRWAVMGDLRAYLRQAFPLVHARLALERVNTHGLLYTWRGSEPALRPTLLLAHQDTVPVVPETAGEWTHPPWSGFYDGAYVWGRGASDCKNTLVASLEAVTALLEAGFRPKRTVLLSFGFDEECSGTQGAGTLAPAIEARYGKDGVAVVVDEGSTFERVWGTLFAKPGTGEKGHYDVEVEVKLPGGHSSIPAPHTSIGVLSEFVTLVEADMYETRLDDANPYLQQLQCGARYAPEFPKGLRKLLGHRKTKEEGEEDEEEEVLGAFGRKLGGCKKGKNKKGDSLAVEAAKLGGPPIRYLMQTSQAVDIIAGGVKVNALPERATATINHRINVGETADVVHAKLTKAAQKMAAKHNLTVHAFEDDAPDAEADASSSSPATAAAQRSITLTSRRPPLPVAPVTPAIVPSDSDSGSPSTPFAVLAGTTRALYGEDMVVTPGIMTGNTDTRYYWGLTRHIFRFSPGYDPAAFSGGDNGAGMGNIHTVDERVSVVNHINAVRWYWLFVRNMDEAVLE